MVYVYYLIQNITAIVLISRSTRHYDEWKDNYASRIACVNYKWFVLHDDDFSCCYEYEYDNPRVIYCYLILMISFVGFYCFIVLALRKTMIDWYIAYFRHVWRNRTLFPPSDKITSSQLSDAPLSAVSNGEDEAENVH